MKQYIPTQTSHPRFKDLTGRQFGEWTVKELLGSYDAKPYWLCICSCGARGEIASATLIKGASTSCKAGHHKRGKNAANYRHGREGTPEYRIWKGMKTRCFRPTAPAYQNYGGRGIKVCGRWLEFANFLEDMGLRPSPKHSLERVDNDADYCPENCKWATKAEQDLNKRSTKLVEWRGEKLPLFIWEKRLGVRPWAIGQRLSLGWSVERAFTQPFHGKGARAKRH